MGNNYLDLINDREDNKTIIRNSFKKNAILKIYDENVVDEMLDKSDKIVAELESLKPNKKNGLLIGKVQSGKTMNFLSIITSAFIKGFRVFVVLTSLDDMLESQTYDRIKTMFDYEKNSSIMRIFKARDLRETSDGQISSKIINELNMDNLIIITCLKKDGQINKILEIFNRDMSSLKKEKLFIIDDEGDLASISHSIKKDNSINLSKANIKISELRDINKDTIYLSVTATPQAQMLLSEHIPLNPERIFTIKPGNGYCGIDYFADMSNNKIEILDDNNDKKQYYQKNLKYIIYYYVLSSIEFFSYKKSNKLKTNMLIHNDIEQIKHEEIAKYTNFIKDKVINSFSTTDDSSSSEILNDFEYVSKKYSITRDIFKLPKENIMEIFNHYFKSLNVFIINEKNKENQNDLNKNILSIVIGSKMLERGITLDNLIVSFFINRPKGKTAIDTMLQRCRWFGYRNDIKNYMKVFTTKQIQNDFVSIAKTENDNWKVFEKAEEECSSFSEISPIIYIDNQKLKPTNKVPLEHKSFKKIYFYPFFENKKYDDEKCNILVDTLINKNNIEKISTYNFLTMEISKEEFLEYNQFIQNETFIDSSSFEFIWNEIKNNNSKIKFVYMNHINGYGKTEIRERSFVKQEDGNYKILQLFQGKNEKYNSMLKNYDYFYIGDSNFCDIDNFNNTVFIQIHDIRCLDSQNNKEKIGERKFIALICPFETNNAYSKKILNKNK